MTSRLGRPAALFGAAAIALLVAAPADAQEQSRWIVTVGGGVQFFPEYPGADSLGIFPLPVIDFRRSDRPMPVEAPDEGWGFGFLGSDSAFDFGPAVQFQSKRRDEDVGAPVGEVDWTIEAGAFAQLMLGDHFRVRAEGRRGLGGHDGWIGDLSADFVLRDADTYIFTIGPRARVSDNDYHDAYFGVTPAAAAATGLPIFDAGSGFHGVGVATGLTYKFDRNWGVYGYGGYDRLIGDAADSPLIRTFGSRDQFSFGAAIFYEFETGNPF